MFVVFIFLLNLLFYFVSDDYKNFIKTIKWSEATTQDQQTFPDDLVIPESQEPHVEDVWNSHASSENIDIAEVESSYVVPEPEEILGRNYQAILQAFETYNLESIELKTNLFDVTNEYPDEYYEYYSRNLTIYFFDTKTYSEVKDIFDVLAYDVSFSINEVNNFGNASFYINLNDDIQDNYVRIVMNYKWVVVGLKIKKQNYNSIKTILESL